MNYVKKDEFTYNWCDFWIAWRVLQIIGFDASNPLTVVYDLGPWLDRSVKDHVTIEIYDADSSKPISFLGQNSFAVESKNFCLPLSNSKVNQSVLYLLSSLLALVEHIEK